MRLELLIDELRKRSVQLQKDGDELDVQADPEMLDPEFIGQLKAHKQELLKLVENSDEEWWCPPPAITPELLPLIKLSQEDIDRIVQSVPGGTSNLQDIYPLAPLQEGILFHYLLSDKGDAYLQTCLYAFDARERVDTFNVALQKVIDRHDILRTSVLWENLPEAVQVVWRKAKLVVEEIVLDPNLDGGEQLLERYNPDHYRLDVRQAPMLKICIAHETREECWLYLVLLHHLIGDQTTMEVIQEEIQAILAGEEARLPEPVPYRNLVAQALLGVSREEHETFFKGMLATVDEPTAPFGIMNVQGDGSGVEEASLDVDQDLVRRIRERASRLGVTAASLCHQAWAQVLALLTGREDVVFGTILFGRMQGGGALNRGIGLFINTLPIKISVSDTPIDESIRRAQDLLTSLMRHEHAPLALAQKCSGVATPAPLFTSLLNYRHNTIDDFDEEGFEEYEEEQGEDDLPPEGMEEESDEADEEEMEGPVSLFGRERTNYPFTMAVDDAGNHLVLTAHVHSSLDPMRACEMMHKALAGIINALETRPSTPACRLDLVPNQERDLLLRTWNETQKPFSDNSCVHQLFEAQAQQSPDRIALVQGTERLTYGELNARANRLAHRLIALGVKPDARVAICLERSPEMVIGLLAVLKAGGAYVPMDPSYPVERLRHMLTDSAPLALLTLGKRMPTGLLEGMENHSPAILDLCEAFEDQPDANPIPERLGLSPQSLAYVIYTSGSTGVPKGVMLEHRGACNLVEGQIQGFHVEADSHLLQFASFSFDACVSEVLVTLCRGAELVLPEKGVLMAGDALISTLKRHGITHVTLPPAVLSALPEDADLAPVQVLITAGDAISESAMKRFGRNRCFINAYGPTETTVCATMHECSMDEQGNPPIGKPMQNTTIYILNSHLQPVPMGVAGEIHIGGAGVARGYLNRPELTAERFIPNPFGAGRLYKTGDLGRWRKDGTIEFLGRNDFQVKIRGFRIELGEIEARLLELPGIKEAAVIAREDVPGSSDTKDKRIVAYMIPTDEIAQGSLTAEALRSHLQGKLPDYMIPAAFVTMEALPLTQNGKLDRKALPAPEGASTREYVPPVGETEIVLAKLWQELLQVEQVGRFDNFFELGGHSLLSVQMVSRLRQHLGIEVPIGEIFTRPALADFAAGIAKAAKSKLPDITLAARGERIPLSLAQQRLWFLAQMGGVSEAYHIPTGIKLRGPLDKAALHKALDRIVARHESLRTTFTLLDGEPVQRIAPAEISHFHLIEEVLRNPADLEAIVEREYSAPFDLEKGPLARGRLIQESPDLHTLLVTMHHIVSDGWSMGILTNEFQTLYAAFSAGEEDPLPSLEVQYPDYAIWQKQHLSGELLQEQAAYWKNRLAGAPTLLELPTDFPRPLEQSYAGASMLFRLDTELSTALHELSSRHGSTLFMTLFAGWAALLSRFSGQDDVVIGMPSANRARQEIENLIGFFVNTLAIRLDLSSDSTVSRFLEHVKTRTLEAQENQDISFEQVVELANPVRSLSHSPLFQTLFNWQNNIGLDGDDEEGTDEDGIEDQGAEYDEGPAELEAEALEGVSYATAKFDLSLLLGEDEDGITGELVFATALFKPETIQRLLASFEKLLRGMAASADAPIAALDILPEEERALLIQAWNATQTPFPDNSCVHQLFEAQAQQNPDRIALVQGDARLTYGQLNERANRLAHRLIALGVKPDARVAICLERSPEMVIGLLAVLKAGGAYVPMDPSYPVERLRHMLTDSAPLALLTLGKRMPTGLLEGMENHSPAILDLCEAFEDQPDANPIPERLGLSPQSLAYVIYTSGSTGVPKGVMLEHRGACNLVEGQIQGFHVEADSHLLQFASFSFDACVSEVLVTLCRGAELVLPEKGVLMAGDALLATLKRHGITHVTLPPAVLSALPEDADLAPVQVLITAGDAISESAMKRFGRNRCFINAYGPTESTVCATMHECSMDEHGNPPIGKPMQNTTIYILNSHLQPVPMGVAGEIHIGGAGVARGYLNRPELTAERFIANPFGAGRLYKTGDLGRWREDGTIEFLGRNDFQVKIRGFRIELGEIEARLLELPGIKEAAVIAREDVPGSSDTKDKRIVAYMIPTDEIAQGSLTAEALRSHLQGKLPDYMIPAAFVTMEALPLTQNGKLDRKALPAPEGASTREYVPPVGETEIVLAKLWQELLQVEQVGRFDNFFELGGHSLMAVALMERMRQAGLNADVRSVFSSPTLCELALTSADGKAAFIVPPNLIPADCTHITPDMLPLISLTEEQIESIASAVPGGHSNIQDIYPLAPLQEGIFFHHLMSQEGDAYLTQFMFEAPSREFLENVLAAMQSVMDRHDILRTSIAWEDLPEPVQVVWRKAPIAFEDVTLDGRQDAMEQFREMFNPQHYRIDLEQAPLMKIFAAQDAVSGRWLLQILFHHLIGDHTTMDVVKEEINAFMEGAGDELPKAAPFRNLVAQARLAISREEHEAFFRNMLGHVDEPTAPFGILDIQSNGSDIKEEHSMIDPELVERLRERARHMGVSTAALCHQAWAQVLAALTGQQDVVFGTILFGRMQGGEGADRGIGLFINTLPIKIGVDETGAEAAVKQTHRLLADLMRHEHANLSLAQQCSAIPSNTPLFTTLLNYRHSEVELTDEEMAEYMKEMEESGEMEALEDGAEGEGEEEDEEENEGLSSIFAKERTNYPLSVAVDDLDEAGLEFTVLAQEAISAQRICDLFARALERLVDVLEKSPSTPLARLDILPDAEKAQMMEEWNDTTKPFTDNACVHQLFEAQAQQSPDRIALVQGDARLTYGQLNERANRLAHRLIALGVKPDARVAICLERSPEMVIGLLAVLKAGGAYVPMDPSYPVERLRHMLTDSAPLALLTLEKRMPTGLLEGLTGQTPAILDLCEAFEDQPDANPIPERLGLSPQSLAYVIYTSGSTGVPKGVMLEHRGACNLVEGQIQGFHVEADSHLLQFASFSFDACVSEVLVTLCRGAELVLPEKGVLMAGDALLATLKRHGITHVTLPPAVLSALPEDADLAPVQVLITAGDAISESAMKRFGRNRCFINAYGPTESTVCATMHECSMDEPGNPPIGKPMQNTTIYILNSHLQPVPMGVPGEIHIGGAGVARGYLNRPELTAERFIANPFGAGRLYKTGDLGRWREDGTIEFLGRNDFQVKIRGFRIELGEIEARLLELPGIKEAAVIAREDVLGSSDTKDKRIVAYMIPTDEIAQGSLTAEALRSHLQGKLPDYMIPAAFVTLEALPLTPNGKLDRKALPVPEGGASTRRAYEAPEGDIESRIAAVWAEILNVEKVGRFDNFFEIGGHSLKAVSATVKLQKEFQLAVQDIFTYPTVAELAENISLDQENLKKRLIASREKLKKAAEMPVIEAALSKEEERAYEIYGDRIEQLLDRDLEKRKPYQNLLLAGATGYLGIHLLAELMENTNYHLWLPIRARDTQSALKRLREKLSYYFGEDKAKALCASPRITVMNADLSHPRMGLSDDVYAQLAKDIDGIINAAANVRHYGFYDDFKAGNVQSTAELLTLAKTSRRKDFHQISTTSVADGTIPDVPYVWFDEGKSDVGQQIDNPYVATKLEGEKLVIEARREGLDARIYRVGNLVFQSKTGRVQENIEENAFFLTFRGFLGLGMLPKELNEAEFSYVDSTAAAIRLLLDREQLKNETFHIHNLGTVSLYAALNKTGMDLKLRQTTLMELMDYLIEQSNNPALQTQAEDLLLHMGLLEDNEDEARTRFALWSDRSAALLKHLGFTWPELQPAALNEMIEKALDHQKP